MGIANIWYPLIHKLQPNHQCISLDDLGYSRSSKPKDPSFYSVKRFAAGLSAVLRHLGTTAKVTLVTHSAGGNIRAAFTLANVDKMSGIVRSGTYSDGKLLAAQGITTDLLTRGADAPSAAVRLYVDLGLDEGVAAEEAKWPAYAHKNVAPAILEYEIEAAYTDIAVPALIVQGAEDKVTPVETCARPIAEAIPAGRLELLEGVGHLPITEDVETVAGLVKDFVEGLKP